MRSTVTLALVALMCSGLAGCGGDGSRVSRHVRDRHAYSLGKEHAERIVKLRNDEPALQDGLLDVRARITNINDRLGPQAATDYERGFVDYITEHDDSLAQVLF